jgi:hypothetical protein
VDPNAKRVADPKFCKDLPGPKIVSFADGFPFLLFSRGKKLTVNMTINPHFIDIYTNK